MKKISSIILNYNGVKDTLECLDSLVKINQEGFEHSIYVVDYSKDISESKTIESTYPSVKVIRKESNLGFAGGNNIGINQALADGADYVCLLNNDTLVSPEFLSRLFGYLEKHPDVGAVSPKIYFEKGCEFHKDRYQKEDLGKVIWYAGGQIDWANMYSSHRGVDEVDKGQFEQTIETDHISGCCVLMRKEAIEKVGFLDENIFLYWEDTEWSIRAGKVGFKLVMYPKACIWHKNAGSSGSGSYLQDYFLSRNRLWVGLRYAPLRTKLALIRQSLVQLRNGRDWEKKGVADFWLMRMGVGSWGKVSS